MPPKRRKHVPLRTCIACRQKRPKRELVRIVRTLEGNIEVDPKGKRPGRGAYLCSDPTCWDRALNHERLGRALKCQVSAADVEDLEQFAKSLVVQATPAAKGEAVLAPEMAAATGNTSAVELD